MALRHSVSPLLGSLMCTRDCFNLLDTTCTETVHLDAGAKSTKGLHVCRHLHRAGWRVVLVDVKR